MLGKNRFRCSLKSFVLSAAVILCVLLSPAMGVTATNKETGNNEYVPQTTIKYNKADQKTLSGVPDTGCPAVFIAEPDSGKIIYEKNAHEKRYPASLTKLLTVLIALEKCELTDTVVVSQTAIDLVPPDYVNIGLQAGEELSVADLICALMLPSANEAAYALAEHIGGSAEAFADMCNNRAKELGCENLHFVNPNGIQDDNHYCTAYDIYLIARECRKFEFFKTAVSATYYKMPPTNKHPEERILKNSNKLLFEGTYYYAPCTGIKTGFTDEAGQCLAASASKDGLDLISVVLGGKINENGVNERFDDTKKLFEFTYNNYVKKDIANSGDVIAKIKVGKATKKTADLDIVIEGDIKTIVPKDTKKEDIATTVSLNDNIRAPIKKNQVLGKITYSVDGLVYTTNLISSHTVNKKPYALYNILVVATVSATVGFFLYRIKKSKRQKATYRFYFIVVSFIEIICIIVIAIIGAFGTKTKVSMVSQNSASDNSQSSVTSSADIDTKTTKE